MLVDGYLSIIGAAFVFVISVRALVFYAVRSYKLILRDINKSVEELENENRR